MASTRIDNDVWQYVCSLHKFYGNPHCSHAMAKQARDIIENAREIIAKKINAEPCEIIFTSSGTAANNLAIAQADGHIVTTAAEHISLLESVVNSGLDYTILNVNEHGLIDTFDLENAIYDDTDLVSVIYANNEIGTITDISTVAKIATVHGALFHADCVAALPHMDVDVKALGLDMASFSAHKLGGLKGTGALYVSKEIDFVPIIHGHETPNVLGIAAFGKSVEILDYWSCLKIQQNSLLQTLKQGILSSVDHAHINNPTAEIPVLNVRFDGVDGARLVQALSDKGVYVSNGSCSNRGVSHVLKAIGLTREQAQSSIRFSIGRQNTIEEINYVVETLSTLVS